MDEALIKRVLPHSVEAEQSVIGSMLMDREAIIAASEIITGADFYQHQYGVMFESMVELFNEGKPVDLVTLQNPAARKRCSAGGQQPGLCPGYHDICADLGQCQIVCQYRAGKGSPAPFDKSE